MSEKVKRSEPSAPSAFFGICPIWAIAALVGLLSSWCGPMIYLAFEGDILTDEAGDAWYVKSVDRRTDLNEVHLLVEVSGD
ncbi:hypothetical protein [Iodidimonas nitroreducens]|nr:hypothetical protein [Iodidimonas nitroreducens]